MMNWVVTWVGQPLGCPNSLLLPKLAEPISCKVNASYSGSGGQVELQRGFTVPAVNNDTCSRKFDVTRSNSGSLIV